jgi:DNA-binding NtrC family response regulator
VERTEFLGDSPSITNLLAEVNKVAQSDHPVLLEGETGTGKQILAQHIHSNSPRADEPFVCINCAAITQSLFESELFGHEKGSFTGAHTRKAGKLELVNQGTLFLDEVGELPAVCQAKLLTVVENRTFERVGGTRTLYFEGRIVAATNRDLDEAMEKGDFRRDLFFRLSTFRFKLPPLREHPEDLPVFIDSTLERCAKEYGRPYDPPDDKTVAQLKEYHWPGNIRELIHHIERIALLSDNRQIPGRLWLSFPGAPPGQTAASASDLATAMDQFKKQHIQELLSECGGNQTEAAKRLGIGRTHLNRLLAEYRREDENAGI